MLQIPTLTDYQTILPLIILMGWSCVLLLVDLFIPRERKGIITFLSVAGLVVTLIFVIRQIGQSTTGFNNMVVVDGFSTFANILLLLSGLFGIALSHGYAKRIGVHR